MAQQNVRTVMHDKYFNMGFREYNSGNGFNSEYNKWDSRDQWRYERGRLFAAATGGRIPVKENTGRRNPKVSDAAIRHYIQLSREKAII